MKPRSPRHQRRMTEHNIQVRIPHEMWEYLQNEAKKQDRSIPYMARVILRQEMERRHGRSDRNAG
jgi:hypothetical protein